VKQNVDGEIDCYSQVEGVDYEETFAPIKRFFFSLGVARNC
jgi:hypothetical protein